MSYPRLEYRESIDKLARDNKPIENDFMSGVLAPMFPNYKVYSNPDQFGKKDYFIDYSGKDLLRIEFEADHNSIFAKHDARWMSGAWNAFNFPARKDPKNFDLFIRKAAKGTGFWAVNAEYIELKATQPLYVPTSNEDQTPDNSFRRIPMPKNGRTFEILNSGKDTPAVFVWDSLPTLKRVIELLIQHRLNNEDKTEPG